jgi:hypothetical protein
MNLQLMPRASPSQAPKLRQSPLQPRPAQRGRSCSRPLQSPRLTEVSEVGGGEVVVMDDNSTRPVVRLYCQSGLIRMRNIRHASASCEL